MIDLQKEYATQNNSISKTLNGTKNIFKNFSDNCKNVMKNLEQKKIDINNDDSINDKTFFAFLADILKSFKDEKNDLLKELKNNEKLTKEKLDLCLKEELKTNNFLSDKNKENIEKFINTQVGNEITNEILAKKISQINDFTNEAYKRDMPQDEIRKKLDDPRFSIKSNDIASINLNDKIIKNDTMTIRKTAKNITKMAY